MRFSKGSVNLTHIEEMSIPRFLKFNEAAGTVNDEEAAAIKRASGK